MKRGLVEPGEDPLQVAAEQLRHDGVDVLHTIGGDDTNGTAADLAAYLNRHGYELTVVGLPKTIDNDVIPIKQTLGAWSAAEQGALYARNIIAEDSSNPRMLIVHEVMGRNCGWLTAATALAHHQWVKEAGFAEWLENSAARWDVHGVFVPERPFDIAEEAKRLRAIMDAQDGVNLFISEGAGVTEIVAAMEAAGTDVPRDPFGHVQLDKINPGEWFAKQFAAWAATRIVATSRLSSRATTLGQGRCSTSSTPPTSTRWSRLQLVASHRAADRRSAGSSRPRRGGGDLKGDAGVRTCRQADPNRLAHREAW